MDKLLSWLLGLGLGATVGGILVALFAPITGPELVANLRQGWQDTLEDARRANEDRKAELEAELTRLKTRPSA